MNEAAFLAAIREDPHDRATRLVYADWLEDRDDPRGELIRIEEEMRTLPAFADRFWQLKPRRNELRAQVPADWREVLGYGTDCLPVFGHGIPEGWKERWRLIREFTERWHGIPMGDVGGREEEVRAEEARLGRALPPSLREWIAFTHEFPRGLFFFSSGSDYEIRELPGESAVLLLLHIEEGYHWVVQHEHLGLTDPPVYGLYGLDYDSHGDAARFGPDERNPLAPTFTVFMLETMIIEANGKGGGFWAQVSDQSGLIYDLDRTFPVQTHIGELDVFEADNLLARSHPTPGAPWIWVTVQVARPLPREAFPASFWEYARYEDGRLVPLPDDDIPF